MDHRQPAAWPRCLRQFRERGIGRLFLAQCPGSAAR